MEVVIHVWVFCEYTFMLEPWGRRDREKMLVREWKKERVKETDVKQINDQ